jgi:leucyl aminopeptidase
MDVKLVKTTRFKTQVQFITAEDKGKPQDFNGKKNEISVRYINDNTIIYCGLGNTDECNNNKLRTAAAYSIQKAIELKRTAIAFISPQLSDISVESIIEGAILGSYSFTEYKSEKPHSIKKVELVCKTAKSKYTKNTIAISNNINFTRDLINGNASEIIPARLASEAKSISKLSKNIACTILTETKIKNEGLGLLYAVGQSAPYPPRLIILEYIGNSKLKRKTALIGKGITFDSGGLNLKPVGHMETMRHDMSGAAVVLGVMKTLAMTNPAINVVGVVSAAYNAIDGKSCIPGDSYKSYSGKTVEIMNTDAEGRLILADAISYCIKKHNPTEIIDLATLTGSIVSALGDSIAGLFSNNDSLANSLFQSGETAGERLWRLPVYEEHRESMKSDIADLRNMSKLKKGTAGSITAAAFLESFVENIPWAHLDIAGVSFNDSDSKGDISRYGTGFGVRLLLNYLTKK